MGICQRISEAFPSRGEEGVQRIIFNCCLDIILLHEAVHDDAVFFGHSEAQARLCALDPWQVVHIESW